MFLITSVFKISAQIIYINTDDTSLVYQVDHNKVYQLHYGVLLPSLQGIENTGLAELKNEIYPSFGNGESNEVALITTHADGTMATDLVYKSHSQTTKGNIQTTTIQLQDAKKPFYVELNFKAYQQENVIEQWVKIYHQEKGEVRLEQYASSAIVYKAQSYFLTHFYGSWGQEMTMAEEQLTNGIKSIETKRGVRAAEYENASFILSLNQKAQEDSGEVYMGALAWSGNFKLGFQLNDQEECQMLAGINPFASAYLLSDSDSFITPKMILTYSNEGKNRASINLHRWARKYNLKKGDQLRPIVLNSWEGLYFKFDENKIKKMIDGAAEMGVEMFVLDDGWFGNKFPRNNSRAGLGDWQVNKKKLPNGIEALVDYTESKGMKFGIWVEPEMVNPRSELYKNHPDWVTDLYLPDGTLNTEKWDEHRLTTWFDTFLPTLDLEKQEVTDFMVDSAIYWITEYDFDGFRHDATKHIPNNFWRTLNKKVKKVSQEKGKYIYQIGETYGSHELINSYIGSGLLDAQFDFNMYDNALPVFATQDESMTRLGEALEAGLSTYGYHHLMGNITGNQDKPRFMSYADGTLSFDTPWMEYKRIGWKQTIEVQDSLAYRKMAMFNAFNLTIPGIPIIYYGDEIGMAGAGDPDNRRMMRFKNLKKQEAALQKEIGSLIQVRTKNLALVYGDFTIEENTTTKLKYTRRYFDNQVGITLNKEDWTYSISTN